MIKTSAFMAIIAAVAGCGAVADNSTDALQSNISANEPNVSVGPTPPSASPSLRATADGQASRSITFADKSSARLEAIKVAAKAGLSDAQCAISVDGQRVDTIGGGGLDAYTCGVLVDSGALLTIAGARRIGLIYRVSSPNASFQTALILVE